MGNCLNYLTLKSPLFILSAGDFYYEQNPTHFIAKQNSIISQQIR